MPGIISGITMVFLPAATSLIVPDKLGGGNMRYFLIGNLIESYFMKANNYYLGSAIAVILSLTMLLLMYLINKLDRTYVKDDFLAKKANPKKSSSLSSVQGGN
jgi:spermidine/putrescine transport system permease protein